MTSVAKLCYVRENESTLSTWNDSSLPSSSGKCSTQSPSSFSSSTSSEPPSSGSSIDVVVVSQGSSDDSLIHVFMGFVVAIGAIGAILNALILRVLLMPEMRRRKFNLLIINQILIDIASSAFLVITYVIKFSTQSLYLEGQWGLAICVVISSDLLIFMLQAGSVANLVLIAIERYLKIVHHVFHSKYIKRWMFYVGIAFTWIDGLVLDSQTPPTSRVIDGQCFYFYFWPSWTIQKTFIVFVIVYQFLLPLAIFVFCYGRILYFVRKKSRVLMVDRGGPALNPQATNQVQAMQQQREMNVIATMIVISVVFAASWLPNQVWAFLYVTRYTFPNSDAMHSVTVFLIFFNVCLNPFVYAVKHRVVNQNLKAWLCRKATINQVEVTSVA